MSRSPFISLLFFSQEYRVNCIFVRLHETAESETMSRECILIVGIVLLDQ